MLLHVHDQLQLAKYIARAADDRDVASTLARIQICIGQLAFNLIGTVWLYM